VRGLSAKRITALLLAIAATAGCNISQLQFKNDHRLSFQSPHSREKVKAPFTIRWSMKDFDATGLDGSRDKNKGAFAVFIDRAPMPVGKDIKWLAKNDTSCKRDPRCPDAEYLASKGVFITKDTSVNIDVLPAVGDGVGDDQHDVIIVLLDGTGHRIGESGWHRGFTSKRRSV
jgi:hypothetical protein